MKWNGLATLGAWDDLSEQITNELINRGFCKKEITSFVVALEEMYINIVNYAYAPYNGVVRTCLTIQGDIVSVQFCDRGRPFNPLKAALPDTTAVCKKRMLGGLGIFMARSKTDNMLYEYTDGENKTTLIKKIKKEIQQNDNN